MQVCISLQTDNHASTPPLKFFTGRMPFLPPNQQRQSTEGTSHHITFDVNMFTFTMQEHTHSCLTALCPGLPGWAGTRKEASLDFTEARDSEWQWHQWAICKSAPCSRQIAMPAPHHSVYYRPDALPATQPTVSKHCRNCEHIFTPMKLEGNWGQK